MSRKNSSKVVEFNQNYFPSPHNAHSQRWSHQLHHGRHLHGNQNSFCKFPKFLNKKWKNLQQTKYAISLRKNLLQIVALNSVAKKSEDQEELVNKTSTSSSSFSSINNVDKSTDDAEFKSEVVFLKLSCIESIKPYSENTRLLRKNSIRKYSLNQPGKSETSGLPSTSSTPPQQEAASSFSSELEFNAKEKLDYLFLVNNLLDW